MRMDRFEALYEEHAQSLLGFLVYRTGSRPVAEDILADTFERALRARGRFDPRMASAKTWLYSIAMNLLRDSARRQAAESRAVERAAVSVGSAGQDPMDEVVDRATVLGSLESLSPEERECVALRYGGDLTVPEIARLVREPVTTVEGRLYRGLRKLRDIMEP